MTYISERITSRIAWCQRQKSQGGASRDLEGWTAEEEGLRDALLNRDHTNQYRSCPPGVFERYMTGLQDGLALIRISAVDQAQPRADRTQG